MSEQRKYFDFRKTASGNLLVRVVTPPPQGSFQWTELAYVVITKKQLDSIMSGAVKNIFTRELQKDTARPAPATTA